MIAIMSNYNSAYIAMDFRSSTWEVRNRYAAGVKSRHEVL